jgi:hypothetical protein
MGETGKHTEIWWGICVYLVHQAGMEDAVKIDVKEV